jgi:hypothetical protein
LVLPEAGIFGNSHVFVVEKNNLQIAVKIERFAGDKEFVCGGLGCCFLVCKLRPFRLRYRLVPVSSPSTSSAPTHRSLISMRSTPGVPRE